MGWGRRQNSAKQRAQVEVLLCSLAPRPCHHAAASSRPISAALYCYHLSPLDNGAYGLIVGFHKAHADLYGQRPIEAGMSAAFRSVSGGGFASRRYFARPHPTPPGSDLQLTVVANKTRGRALARSGRISEC